MLENTYALILAGGSGTRFWPLSRNDKPKQLLNLFDDETLIEKTVNRLIGLIPEQNIFVLTNQLQYESVVSLLSQIPKENIYAEPEKRDTAPAVALGVGLITAKDPNATMMVLPADQLINDTAAFQSIMNDAVQVASHTDAILTVGIKPTWASPSFGYIERGEPVASIPSDVSQSTVREVLRFREKPDTALAENFLAKGNFSWNAGMFFWSVPTVRAELQQHCPQLDAFIQKMCEAECVEEVISSDFPQLEAISFDYAVMEHAKKIYTIEATFDWDDVGSWLSVSKYLDEKDDNKSNSPLVTEDARDNIVFTESGGKQVALLGVKDLIVVQTEDAILVANKHDADQIKKIVAHLPPELT